MKINHNITAVLANHRLKVTEGNLSASVNKLSSGYKINSAKDNPAGFAIAHKMNTQIRGLERASDNALDGVSAIETAEGAITEIQSMIQRLRELAVQSANDTYTVEDREAIQIEAENLQDEIERISKETEFNKKNLLDGSFDTRAYSDTDGVSASLVSDSVHAGTYEIEITKLAEKASIETTPDATAFGVAEANAVEGTIAINGLSIVVSTSESLEAVYEKMREKAEIVGVDVERTGGTWAFEAGEYGSSEKVEITAIPSSIATALGLDNAVKTDGADAEVNLVLNDGSANPSSLFSSTATYSSDGEHVKVTDRGGFEMTIKVDNEKHQDILNDNTASLGGTTSTIDVKDFGYMTLQIGANEDQTMDVRIPEMSLENMGIENLNYLTHESASKAIVALDEALSFVSSVRSKLGAYQNRLDHTISSLGVAEESLTSA